MRLRCTPSWRGVRFVFTASTSTWSLCVPSALGGVPTERGPAGFGWRPSAAAAWTSRVGLASVVRIASRNLNVFQSFLMRSSLPMWWVELSHERSRLYFRCRKPNFARLPAPVLGRNAFFFFHNFSLLFFKFLRPSFSKFRIFAGGFLFCCSCTSTAAAAFSQRRRPHRQP